MTSAKTVFAKTILKSSSVTAARTFGVAALTAAALACLHAPSLAQTASSSGLGGNGSSFGAGPGCPFENSAQLDAPAWKSSGSGGFNGNYSGNTSGTSGTVSNC